MKVNDRPLLGVKRGFLGLQFGDYPSKPVDISLYTPEALGRQTRCQPATAAAGGPKGQHQPRQQDRDRRRAGVSVKAAGRPSSAPQAKGCMTPGHLRQRKAATRRSLRHPPSTLPSRRCTPAIRHAGVFCAILLA